LKLFSEFSNTFRLY